MHNVLLNRVLFVLLVIAGFALIKYCVCVLWTLYKRRSLKIRMAVACQCNGRDAIARGMPGVRLQLLIMADRRSARIARMRLIHVVSSDQRSRKKKRVITVNYTPMIGQDLEKLRISMRWRTKISDVVRSIKRLLIKLINRKGDNSI